ncbi:MAG: MgtC/SapB family protein [Albidovulum sp.]|uniref:MgtC/SapB family protein n=1 Tax=Albidovulum sp. TaxID=1872424 RepID=UPI00132BDAE9|nr:MgtC/SapB family protein [Defluviimonas sp.]KAB2879711.1 MAG: MgtC/SapB family protein [Defluviimonas sp.]
MDFLIAARLEFAPEVTATALPIVVLRLLAAAVLGGIVGFERELHARNAGLRTHMLISVAACLFALVGLELMAIAEAAGDEAKADPLRLIEAVTAGVAFLVAGSIISSGGRVQGLTTGAGMWLSGATGLACGTGHLALATVSSALGVVILWCFRPVSDRIGGK